MNNVLPKPLIIIISLIQAIVLTLLYQSNKYQLWPSTDQVWFVGLVTFAISFPLLTLLSVTKTNIIATTKYLLPFTLLLSALGGYVGYQLEPLEFVDNNFVIFIFCFTALIAAFKALMYIQQYLSNEDISYSSLFKLSWRNFIIFGECWLFVLIFWGILQLGAGLFSVLGIYFFYELLQQSWFVIPILTFAFGFAIMVFRNTISTVDSISTILQTLIKFLLPALIIVSLGFLATLPFTGLVSLWETGAGSLLLLWLQALTLFFVNSVYQDASHERPYHQFLHRLIFIGVAILPIYSLISFYGLWLRVDQYGLTVDRCWAILICILLACFSFGYLIGIIKKRDAWLETLSTVNIAMGIIVLITMLLVNSPLLNFQSLSVSSQISRLDDGKITIDDFDYKYFQRSLGRQGYLALQELKKEFAISAPEKAAFIERMYLINQSKDEPKLSIEEFNEFVSYWPNKDVFPESLLTAVYDDEWFTSRGYYYYFVAQNLNGDDELDYIVIREGNNFTNAHLWYRNSNKWRSNKMKLSNPHRNNYIKRYLSDNNIEVLEPKWKVLKIGDLTIDPN